MQFSRMAIALSLGLGVGLGSVGCGNDPVAEAPSPAPEPVVSSSSPEPTQSPVAQAPTAPSPTPAVAPEPEVTASYPEIVEVLEMQVGDLQCYTVVRDRQGQIFDIGATFDVCERADDLINQTVRLAYSVENVADCESAEPCGRTRQATLISNAVKLGQSWQVLSNGTWTVTVGQLDSWDGTNNTGNLTYYGCDDQGNCLALTNGFTVCRNGVCNMSWENGNYAYTLSSEMTETGDGATTLLVWQNGNEILRAENMELMDSSDF